MGEYSNSADLRSALPPVRNQGHRPTCLSFAASTVHEFERRTSELLSVESLHHAAKAVDGLDANLGTTTRAVLDAVADPGQCSERAWPYGSPQAELDGEVFYTAGHQTASNGDLNLTVRRYIAAGRPVVVCLQITEAWLRPSPDGWIRTGTNDDGLGSHAVVAVAYDSSDEAVLVRNSWGRSWAQDGYAWLPDDHLLTQGFAWFVLDPIGTS